MSELSRIKNTVEQLKGQRKHLKAGIKNKKTKIEQLQKSIKVHEQAKEVIKTVGLKTQSQISFHVSEITTLALDAVLVNPYSLELNFVERRDKTECDLLFNKDGMCIKPYDGGGGPVDIAAFALRVASWSMKIPHTRNTLILDEPFKHLKGEAANKRMLDMVNEISKKLGIQIIMVSDERVSRGATIEVTDTLIETTIKDGITKLNIES